MRALVFDSRLTLEEQHPAPLVGPDEALIRVSVAGVCNTDLEIMIGYTQFTGVLGHEFVGVVCSSPDPAWIGKRVCGEINVSCGACSTCVARAMPNHCPGRQVLGISGRNGAFAEYLSLPVRNLHLVPDHVPDEDAVFVEPLAAAFEILEQVTIAAHDQILILGDGKLGVLCAQVIAASGARVVVAGKHAAKLKLVSDLGIQAVDRSTIPESQADVVVEATGTPGGLEDAMRAARPQGTIVLKSTTARTAALNLSTAVVKEQTIVGSRCGPFQRAIRALSHEDVAVRTLVSDRFPLVDGLKAIKRAAERDSFKVLIEITV